MANLPDIQRILSYLIYPFMALAHTYSIRYNYVIKSNFHPLTV